MPDTMLHLCLARRARVELNFLLSTREIEFSLVEWCCGELKESERVMTEKYNACFLGTFFDVKRNIMFKLLFCLKPGHRMSSKAHIRLSLRCYMRTVFCSWLRNTVPQGILTMVYNKV